METTMMGQNGIEAVIGQREIERMVERGGRFLRAVGTRPAIMRDLLAVGYDVKEHQAGWGLFLALCGYELGASAEISRSEAQAAMDELNAWDGPAFARARAALGRHYPEQASHVFAGLEAQTGLASVAACKLFVDRVQALREGSDPARAATREADLQAVALLEQRRVLTPEIEARLRGLLEQAMQFSEIPVDLVRERSVQSAAHRFRAWLADWRATAAVTIARRDHLISLGLAARRTPSGEVEEDSIEPEPELEPAPELPAADPIQN